MPLTKVKNSVVEDNTISQEKIYGGGITPTGTILPFALITPPSGWLLCDGQQISRSTYSDLFDLFTADNLISLYGAGDGSTTFNLPDLADRIPVGKGSTKTSLGAKGGAVNMTPSGSVSSSASGGGVSNTTITTSTMPPHDHGANSGFNGQPLGSFNGLYPVMGQYTAGCYWRQGGGSSHGHGYTNPSVSSSFSGDSMSVEQPYTVINYIIKY